MYLPISTALFNTCYFFQIIILFLGLYRKRCVMYQNFFGGGSEFGQTSLFLAILTCIKFVGQVYPMALGHQRHIIMSDLTSGNCPLTLKYQSRTERTSWYPLTKGRVMWGGLLWLDLKWDWKDHYRLGLSETALSTLEYDEAGDNAWCWVGWRRHAW